MWPLGEEGSRATQGPHTGKTHGGKREYTTPHSTAPGIRTTALGIQSPASYR